ncbi:hypothetical protein [Enterococcus sp. CSURQ0835]|uniref:hypothetical protein n=1 Tax=Enterococcus sp. CSURQ0835 TaxID=2681394 RepID=UPI001359E1E6|nr:hypothetical protein [Enterococcus sp. CSURQ0835]
MKKKLTAALAFLLILLPCVTSGQVVLGAGSETSTSLIPETSIESELATKFSLESLLAETSEENEAAERTVTTEEGSEASTEAMAEGTSESEPAETTTEKIPSSPQAQADFSVVVERNGGDIALREAEEATPVNIDWKLSDQSRVIVQFNKQTNALRKIELIVAPGILIPKTALAVIEAKESVVKVERLEERTEPIYALNSAIQRSEYYLPKETNQRYQDYFHGGKIVVHFEANAAIDGFYFPIRSSYGGNASDPSFWSGIQHQSLNRQSPALQVALIEDEQKTEKRVLDDLVNSSSIGHSVIIKNNAIPNSQDPGPQLVDKKYSLTLNARVRNNDMSTNDNSYQLTNPTYELYVPYKESETEPNKFISAELLTTEMDDWIQTITASNDGNKIFNYKHEVLADGRIKVTYYFTDPQQEYLLQVLNLQLHYRYPADRFQTGDTVYYTKDNLGRKYESAFNGATVTSEAVSLTDSDRNPLKIVDDTAFDFEFLSSAASNPIRLDVINMQNQHVNHLLGYSSITNKTNAKGEADVKYKFDINNTWHIGVTMVQFWTVDSAEDLAAARNYEYDFSFTLQKKGAIGETDKLVGNYKLTPAKVYQNKKITQSFGVEKSLLGFPNERYYYYVNREMLAQGLGQVPVDLENYYIKELSYTFKVAAKDDGNYVSGDKGRVKESGGQYYGHLLTDKTNANGDAHSTMEIQPAAGYNGNNLKRTIITRPVVAANATTKQGADIGLFIDGHKSRGNQTDPMTIIDSAGRELKEMSDRVDVGEKLTVKATALSTFYPYGASNYSPNPVFYLRTPTALTLLEDSIKLAQGNKKLNYRLEQLIDSDGEPLVLEGTGGYFYRVEVLDSDGLGYYDEEREMYGERISIEYQMEVNIASDGRPIEYRELLFVGDKNYTAAATGSYAAYMVNDRWGLTESMPNAGWANTYYYTPSNAPPSYNLCSTNLDYSFTTNSPNLNFGLNTRLSNDVLDPTDDGTRSKGVLDKNDQTFKATFSMDNIHQKGYVDSKGMFIAYLPIAKQDVKPEWLTEEELADYSLALKGELEIKSQKGVTYDIGYTTAQEKFNNHQDTFTGENGFATYQTYEEVKDKLDQVTMIKIIGRADGDGMIIPFGEQLTATMTLSYGGAKDHVFEELAGEKVSYRPYVVQIYTINRIATMFRTEAPKNELRIRYRPDQKEIELWAYKEADYPNDTSLNKTLDLPLPNFVNEYELVQTPGDFYSFNLDTIDNLVANQDHSVSYGNSTFALGTGLNLLGSDPAYIDLAQAAGQSLGKTGTVNKLNYKIYNANNINDTLGERSLIIHYQSQDSDDLDFKVKIKVLRKASKIKVENALMAGKVYKEFSASADNVKKTLQDGALTVQYAYDTSAITEGLPAKIPEDDFFLQFASTAADERSAKVSLPPGDTILMKVQSTKTVGDKVEKVRPEYYYYRNETNDSQAKILLKDFYQMGENKTEATQLTKAKMSAHAKEADQLSYLFIFDFENQDTAIHELATGDELDLIQLSFPTVAEEGKVSERNDIPTSFEVAKKAEVVQRSVKTNQAEYASQEPIEVSGDIRVSKAMDAVDAFNQYKLISVTFQLLEQKANGVEAVDWPAGTMIQKKNLDGSLETANYSRLKEDQTVLVAPFERVDPNDHQPGQSMPNFGGKDYKFQINTPVEALAAGKSYQIRVQAHKARSSFYPLLGERLENAVLDEEWEEQAEGEAFYLPITIKDKPSGLKVKSTMKERLVYNGSPTQTVNFKLMADNIDKVEPVLEIQRNGTTFEEVPDWEKYIETARSDNLVPTGEATTKEWEWTMRFKADLPAELNGEYRILFKAYREKVGDFPGAPVSYEQLHEVPWSFAIWDPLPN